MVEYLDNTLNGNLSLLTLSRGETLMIKLTVLDITGKKFSNITGATVTLSFNNFSKVLGQDVPGSVIDPGRYFFLKPEDTKYMLPGSYDFKVTVQTSTITEVITRGVLILQE